MLYVEVLSWESLSNPYYESSGIFRRPNVNAEFFMFNDLPELSIYTDGDFKCSY